MIDDAYMTIIVIMSDKNCQCCAHKDCPVSNRRILACQHDRSYERLYFGSAQQHGGFCLSDSFQLIMLSLAGFFDLL